MLKVAIIGASGYTGLELLRILASHPAAKVVEATSRQYAGQSVEEVFPSLRGFYEGLKLSDPTGFTDTGADIFFSCLPHGASMETVSKLVNGGGRVIDLSADFRLRDASLYKAWYGEHTCPKLLAEAVYGLPELNREQIKDAVLVANPGCYPTGAILALTPLLDKGLVAPGSIIIDSKSGVSGAGRGAALETSFVEAAGSVRPYKVGTHRHTPEIEQELAKICDSEVKVTFTPHLVPVSRGILTTAYAGLKSALCADELLALYAEFYKDEPFVRTLAEGSMPDTNKVRCSNYCDIGLVADPDKARVVVISAIDNLTKGASGQAVQNMNIMSSIEEKTALASPPIPL